MARLQGIRPSTFYKVVNDYELGQQIGNAMSVNVVERILYQVFQATPMVKKLNLRDRWVTGEGQRALIESRNATFRQRPKQIYGQTKRNIHDHIPSWTHGEPGLRFKFMYAEHNKEVFTIVDSGASFHMANSEELTFQQKANIRTMSEPISLELSLIHI